MLKQQREKQQKMNLVIMEQLVPEDHFLRKVDRAIGASWVHPYNKSKTSKLIT